MNARDATYHKQNLSWYKMVEYLIFITISKLMFTGKLFTGGGGNNSSHPKGNQRQIK